MIGTKQEGKKVNIPINACIIYHIARILYFEIFLMHNEPTKRSYYMTKSFIYQRFQ
jgi:uncharacterized MAPEG superfamily protein